MAMAWNQAASLNEATKVIAVADVVESVRLMEQDEGAFIRRWQRFLGFVVERLPQHAGRLHKSLGDGLMLEFSDPESCIVAARAMHEWFGATNQQVGPEAHVHLRIGAHVAHFVADAYDIYGNDVNLAARIASLAGPGEIVVSAALRNRVGKALRTQMEDLGTCHLKHVRAPVHAFRIGQPGRAPVVPAGSGGAQPWRPLVVVLPFAVRGRAADPSTGETVADDVVAALTHAGHVDVMSRLSSVHLPRRSLRDELGAAYVLAGHVRREGGRLAVFAELSEARTGRIAWARSFRADAQDFAGSGGALAMAAAVHAAIVANETAHASAQALPALDATTLLVAAIALMHALGAPEMERAQAMLEHLAERWPRRPEPHAWLAHLHLLRWQQGGSPDAVGRARSEAAQALQCDGAGALAQSMEARVAAHSTGDWRAAEERYAQVLALHADDALALLFRAEARALLGDGAAAQAYCESIPTALPLPPLLQIRDVVHAQAVLAQGEPGQALALATHVLERNPLCVAAHFTLAAAQVACGQREDARETLGRLRQRGVDVRAALARIPAGSLRRRIEPALRELASG